MERTVNKSGRLMRHLAVAAAAACTVGASAEVIYRTYNFPVGATIDGLYVNVETGITYDGANADTSFAGWDLNPYGSSTMSFFWSATTNGASAGVRLNTVAGGTTSGTTLSSLPAGFVVGAQLIGGTSGASFGTGSASFTTTSQGKWNYNAANYFGFRFTGSDGAVRYGWGRMQMGATATVRTLVDIAFENTPGASITVGDQGGPPPAYDPCASFNPKANIGTASLSMNGTTAQDLAVPQFTIFKANYFKFDCTASGTYTIGSCSSSVDTRMAVLSACTSGATVLAADDNGCGVSSTMEVSLTGGTSYYVVCGMAAASATVPPTVAITVAPPPIPACVAAMPLSFGTNSIDSTAGTGSQLVKTSATGGTTSVYNVVWHKFRPLATGQYTFSMCGSFGDSKMAISATCPGVGGTFDSLAYNDDTCACSGGCGTAGTEAFASELSPTSITGLPLTQALVAGQTYYLCIGGYAAADFPVGTMTISGPPQPPSCPADLDSNGVVDGADLGMLLGNWGNPGIGDINNDGIVNGADLGALLGAFGPCI